MSSFPETYIDPVTSAKQPRDPCSGPLTKSTRYRKCVSNFPSNWLANRPMAFLTGQSWHVLKSWCTWGREQGFRRWIVEKTYHEVFTLVSSVRKATLTEAGFFRQEGYVNWGTQRNNYLNSSIFLVWTERPAGQTVRDAVTSNPLIQILPTLSSQTGYSCSASQFNL